MKELLERYSLNLNIINFNTKSISKLKKEEVDPSTASLSGMPCASGFMECALENKAVKRIDKILLLEEEMKVSKEEIKIVDKFLSKLKDNNKRMFELYYIDNLTFKMVAFLMNEKETTIQKRINTILKRGII